MPEDLEIKEADPPAACERKGEGDPVKEQGQVEAEEKLFNSSTITVVLQLMPVDGDPRGRMGLLSIRNDNEAPLFGAILRGEELAEILNVPSVARLIEDLKQLLPRRQEEREARAKEQAVQVNPRPLSASVRTASEKGKTTQKKPDPQPKVMTNSTTSSGTTEQAATDNNPSVPRSAFTPEPVPEVVPDPVKVEETLRQLTLF